jgi:ribosomal protein S18 acetylase RimI-like enzyme
MKITEFKEEDAEEVARLSNENSRFFCRKSVSREFLLKFVHDPRFKMFIARDGNTLIGFGGVNVEHYPPEIGPICVEEGHRRQGIAKELLDKLFDFLGHSDVITRVKKGNKPSLEFFKDEGFKEVLEDKGIVVLQHGS